MGSQKHSGQGKTEVNDLESLYTKYAPSIFSYLYRLSGSRPLAEDLTSETFYKAILAMDKFRGDASVKTWLLRIARNLYLRHKKREQRITSLEDMQTAGVKFTSPETEPEAHLVNQEQGENILNALLALSESDRSILLLSSQEDLPYREITLILDISLSAVKVRLHRARQRFAIAYENLTTGKGVSHG